MPKTKLPPTIRKHFPDVDYIVDADYPIDIAVDKEDCRDAKQLDPTNCALARAAKRAFNADAVVIGINTSYIIRGKRAVRFATPEHVTREIVSFDRSGDFEPGTYKLVPKAPTSRLGVNKKSYHKKKEKGAVSKIQHSARVRILD